MLKLIPSELRPQQRLAYSPPTVSVIIPTFNEWDNVALIAKAVGKASS